MLNFGREETFRAEVLLQSREDVGCWKQAAVSGYPGDFQLQPEYLSSKTGNVLWTPHPEQSRAQGELAEGEVPGNNTSMPIKKRGSEPCLKFTTRLPQLCTF